MTELTFLDVDARLGREPSDAELVTVRRLGTWHARHGIGGGLVASLRAGCFDLTTGNDEAIEAATRLSEHDVTSYRPVAYVDLRDPVGSERELRRVADRGVRVVRFAPGLQNVPLDSPGLTSLARQVADLGLLALVEGDVRTVWRPFVGRGARVVFLDTHFYHLGDFLVLARDEPGFCTSTRLLVGPDSLEVVAAEAGVDRLVFGTRAPWDEATVPRLRLHRSRLDDAQRAAVAAGNLARLLDGAS